MSDDAGVLATLLPPNSSLLERAVDLTFAALLERIEPPFPELMSPQATPVDFLPYLAADRAVIGWDSTAAEADKRAAVLASWPTKRLAGTRKALRLAMETTGFVPRFVPWHESGAAPYTLQIVATSDRNQTAADYVNLGHRIGEAKAERDVIEIRVEKRIPLAQRLRLAQFVQQAGTLAVMPEPIRVETPPVVMAIGTALQSARVWTLRTMTAVTATPLRQYAAGVLRAATLYRIEAIDG